MAEVPFFSSQGSEFDRYEIQQEQEPPAPQRSEQSFFNIATIAFDRPLEIVPLNVPMLCVYADATYTTDSESHQPLHQDDLQDSLKRDVRHLDKARLEDNYETLRRMETIGASYRSVMPKTSENDLRRGKNLPLNFNSHLLHTRLKKTLKSLSSTHSQSSGKPSEGIAYWSVALEASTLYLEDEDGQTIARIGERKLRTLFRSQQTYTNSMALHYHSAQQAVTQTH